jgi:hypothetical protein
MEVMRVPPYPIVTTWELPIPNYEYIQYVEDLVDHSVVETPVTSDANGVVEYILPLDKVQYDRRFYIKFYDAEHEHTLYEENLDIIRPYVNAKKLGTTASEISEYRMLELVSRAVIDTIIPNGFYNYKKIVQAVGQGSDYFPLWYDTNKVLKVYENNVLVYDVDTPELNQFDYVITLDNSAIQRVENGVFNRAEQSLPNLPIGRGDLGYYGVQFSAFPQGYDYTFILDSGYKTIPSDVEYATQTLMEDIKCGKLDYYKRYITAYNTDQFRIQFDKSVLDGTGNMLVDKILDKYANTILKPGII